MSKASVAAGESFFERFFPLTWKEITLVAVALNFKDAEGRTPLDVAQPMSRRYCAK